MIVEADCVGKTEPRMDMEEHGSEGEGDGFEPQMNGGGRR